MSFSCGLVGLPNVGKSTLFNALTSTGKAEAANYPFCTIDPNIATVAVPDDRLIKLAELAKSAKLIFNKIQFVDIAGLIKGASQGEGLGNKFLAHILNTDVIAYVLRCFDDPDIIHVNNKVDPLDDLQILQLELILADIQNLEKKLVHLEKKAKQDKNLQPEVELIKELLNTLNQNKIIYSIVNDDNRETIDKMNLLTSKPFFCICNVKDEDIQKGNKYTTQVAEYCKNNNIHSVIISAKIEEEISQIDYKQEFFHMLGIKESGLTQIIKTGYTMLDLITFFTVGPKEAHAWSVKKGAKAPQAAGRIHSDFERGFIAADVIKYHDYIEFGENAKAAGKLNIEGRNYSVQDGDIIYFKFNV